MPRSSWSAPWDSKAWSSTRSRPVPVISSSNPSSPRVSMRPSSGSWGPDPRPVPTSAPIRVLIVDDSYFMRKVLKDLLSEDGQIQVLDTAQTGEEAIEKTLALKPDVITMDFEMPRMDGLEALERIMGQRPTPV